MNAICFRKKSLVTNEIFLLSTLLWRKTSSYLLTNSRFGDNRLCCVFSCFRQLSNLPAVMKTHERTFADIVRMRSTSESNLERARSISLKEVSELGKNRTRSQYIDCTTYHTEEATLKNIFICSFVLYCWTVSCGWWLGSERDDVSVVCLCQRVWCKYHQHCPRQRNCRKRPGIEFCNLAIGEPGWDDFSFREKLFLY